MREKKYTTSFFFWTENILQAINLKDNLEVLYIKNTYTKTNYNLRKKYYGIVWPSFFIPFLLL
jgi:hypothetical protein